MGSDRLGWRLLFLPLMLCGVLAAKADTGCRAGEPDCVAVGEWQFSVGLGLGVRTNPLAEGSDLPILVLPEISYYGERFFWDTTNIGFTLVETRHHSLSLLATVGLDHMYFHDWSIGNFVIEGAAGNFTLSHVSARAETSDPDSDKDSDNFDEPDSLEDSRAADEGIRTPNPSDKDGPNEFFHSPKRLAEASMPEMVTISLDKRRMAVLGGIDYSFYWQDSLLGVQWLHDLSGVHDGHELRLGLDRRWRLGQQQLGLAAGAVWQSRDLVDYYYGVKAHEIEGRSDLTYAPGHALTPYARIDWSMPLTQRWSLQATLHHKWFDSTISNSPIVDKRSSTSVFVGGVYHF